MVSWRPSHALLQHDILFKRTRRPCHEWRSWSWDIKSTFRLLNVDFYINIQMFGFPKLLWTPEHGQSERTGRHSYETVLPPSSKNLFPRPHACLRFLKLPKDILYGDRKRPKSNGWRRCLLFLLLFKHFFLRLECNFLHQHPVLYSSKLSSISRHGNLKVYASLTCGVAFLPSLQYKTCFQKSE